MRRGVGYQQQYYGSGNDGGMWTDSAQQQQSYAVQQESWGSENEYHHHKQFPGMHMKHSPSSSSSFGMRQESFEDGWRHGYEPRRSAYEGGDKFSSSGYNYSEKEVEEYDHSYSEERYDGAAGVRRQEYDDETRYDRHKYGFNPYHVNVQPKPQYGYRTEWRPRGV